MSESGSSTKRLLSAIQAFQADHAGDANFNEVNSSLKELVHSINSVEPSALTPGQREARRPFDRPKANSPGADMRAKDGKPAFDQFKRRNK